MIFSLSLDSFSHDLARPKESVRMRGKSYSAVNLVAILNIIDECLTSKDLRGKGGSVILDPSGRISLSFPQ